MGEPQEGLERRLLLPLMLLVAAVAICQVFMSKETRRNLRYPMKIGLAPKELNTPKKPKEVYALLSL